MSLHILTNKGEYFPFDQPTLHDFDPEEIAHALSHLCRFTGHVRQFYSVAQHCVHVASLVPAPYRLEALLHDASEAYLGDVASPLKRMLPDYKAIERRVEAAIRSQYALPPSESPEVKIADMRMLVTERRDLMPKGKAGFVWPDYKPAEFRVTPWDSETASSTWLQLFNQYQREYLHGIS